MNYFLENWHKFLFILLLLVAYQIASSWYLQQNQVEKTEQSLNQLEDFNQRQKTEERHYLENNGYILGWGIVFILIFLVFLGDLRRMCKKICVFILIIFAFSSIGCYRPFEPVKLEVISSNEEAFLLPLVGDSKKQTSTDNEEYLKENLVYTKQVKIPQQWVPKGFETWGANGKWEDAAILLKVDKSPVTREWTADPNSGTSNKNEAIWVMTSDQVEFSTGWTVTARIASREDAIKFLHHYPNGSLTKVLDSEVRAKLQAVFGLEVTDLPMDTLRKSATPHITKTVKEVTLFFKERGINITNLGITGGFIYKDPSVLSMMVKVFNSEQEKSIAAAEATAQEERNKKLLSMKKAEADGIKLVADAKLYEMEKSADKMASYVQLKQLELYREMLQKWDGSFPRYFMGNNNPNTLLQLPPVNEGK